MDHSLDQSTLSDLSDNQEILLAVLQLSSATLSLVGSYTIVYKIVLNLNRNKTTTPYELIMLGLSGCDILASVTYAMGPFLLPRETSQRITALGDDSTCSKLGFLTQFACVWAVWYNALLSYYYLLTVRYQVKPLEFRRKYELWMHLSGVIFFSITAIVGLMGDWYSEERLTMACWIDEVPNGCRAAGNICYGSLAAYIFGGVPMAITLFSLIINNIVIYLFVRNTLLSSPTTAIISSSSSSNSDSNSNSNSNIIKELRIHHGRHRGQRRRIQARERRLGTKPIGTRATHKGSCHPGIFVRGGLFIDHHTRVCALGFGKHRIW
jgi:hypothetical protein